MRKYDYGELEDRDDEEDENMMIDNYLKKIFLMSSHKKSKATWTDGKCLLLAPG